MKEEALQYHSQGRKGKIEVNPSKPCLTQHDLSLAYTPGVAEPCLEIQKDPLKAFEYTTRGNLVAVITNGTAVLGLGNIGALAGKPVMEGKGVLFKRFADIDVFDIELDTKTPEEFIKVVQALEPTFGGINLEDIRAPECFVIEKALTESMQIPVFHDDQHGTAIICSAALLNALEVAGKKIGEVKIVVSGAGAAAVGCARLFLEFGAKKENLCFVDSKGAVYKGRKEGMNEYKEEFAVKTSARSLAEAMKGADVFLGLSVAGLVTPAMVKSMAKNPIVFAMANPNPEISYPEAKAVREDIIMATGRSDYPNQVNNVLGFPFIFRGALDVRARGINTEMKKAASLALAALAKEDVPEIVSKAYGDQTFKFGRDYIIPKPFDPRVLLRVAPAVARAAIESGVAQKKIEDWEVYLESLERLFGKSREVMRPLVRKAKEKPVKLAFCGQPNPIILKAVRIIREEGLANPVLVGDRRDLTNAIHQLELPLKDIAIYDPEEEGQLIKEFAQFLHQERSRKGVTYQRALKLLQDPTYFGCMMVRKGMAGAVVSEITYDYPTSIRPILHTLRLSSRLVATIHLIAAKNDLLLFTDTTMNIDPSEEDLTKIGGMALSFAKQIDMDPRVAFISYSNFGSVSHPTTRKVRRAAAALKELYPNIEIDGEMQADVAVNDHLLKKHFNLSHLKGPANVLIFPDLQSANSGYKLLKQLAGITTIGPVIVGLDYPAVVLDVGATETDVVNLATIAARQAQLMGEPPH